ncbi:hypothetical protein CEXT_794461 [Caerostris extrusa]|uniref:Uncharacterized protein n=1 Tax=Caerostris extrusa TaxID=172846 RepID=A0AAV4Y7R3_CAEEX|nr:hypothetical protein CEXT_794461 [Caerostris extrusa]
MEGYQKRGFAKWKGEQPSIDDTRSQLEVFVHVRISRMEIFGRDWLIELVELQKKKFTKEGSKSCIKARLRLSCKNSHSHKALLLFLLGDPVGVCAVCK